MKLLIVDDNEADRYLLIRDLEEAGYTGEILEAEHGVKALEIMKNQDQNTEQIISLIFLDINMPLMDGFEFLQHYSESNTSSPLNETKVFMYSSSARQEDKDKVSHLPFVKGFLVKGEYQTTQLQEILQL